MNHSYDSQLKIIRNYYKQTINYHRHNYKTDKQNKRQTDKQTQTPRDDKNLSLSLIKNILNTYPADGGRSSQGGNLSG